MEYEPYKYAPPEELGYTLIRVKRGWLLNRYQYERDTPYNRLMEDKHPNWLYKTIAIVLFPVSVVMTGAPDAWRDTYRHIWDRKYGSFTSVDGWTG
jgi:hypothetical protein